MIAKISKAKRTAKSAAVSLYRPGPAMTEDGQVIKPGAIFRCADRGFTGVVLAAADEAVMCLNINPEYESDPDAIATVTYSRAVRLLPVPPMDVSPFLAGLPGRADDEYDHTTPGGLMRIWHGGALMGME